MSATLRVSDFAENKTLFATPPPIIHIPARQHPVTVHFSRRTASDYVSEAVKKASKIHARLPPGGILIFLTGQNEITGVCRKLEARYGAKALEERRKMRATKMRPPEREAREDAKTTSVAPAQGRPLPLALVRPGLILMTFCSRCGGGRPRLRRTRSPRA